ncbi:MAG TPA: ParB/RepB/Spo0J family partition protein [Planctomycetota bacterium]|nr:ParB/RepB/Spo0J family partition protein [Planctomycetota bacterium]
MSHFKRLGMGLGALIGGESEPAGPPTAVKSAPAAESVSTMEINTIRPNPYQPRTEFDPKDIETLSESLKKDGLLQPVVVRPAGAGFYQLVAGERRWRAAKLAGLARIPVVVRNVEDKKMLELALVENLQRRDLNPMEKARAFKQLMTLNSWTQEQLADSLGMGRPTVANFVRLLDLQVEVQDAVSKGAITMGHARALVAIDSRVTQLQRLKQILADDLSVRALEKLAGAKSGSSAKSAKKSEPYLKEFEQKLMDKLGVRVQIQPDSIVISYTSKEELTRVLKRLDVI